MGAKTKDMKKITYTALMLVSAFSVMFSMFSCNDYETYADKKKKDTVKLTVVRAPLESAVFENAVLAFEKET